MKTFSLNRVVLLLALAGSLGLSATFLGLGFGCGTVGPGTTLSGGIPATPPGPPAEVPSLLTIPSGDDLAINVDKIASSSASPSESVALKASTASTCDPSLDFSKVVGPTGDTAKFIEDDLNSLLNPYSQLAIPVGTNIHNFQGLSVVQKIDDVVFVQMKIDFSDFDFDGDGFKEGCSGNTQQLPICMRIWANGKKEMAAVFTDYPAKDRPGAGRLMGLNITNSTFLFPEDGILSIIYDHSDPSTSLTTELLTREEVEEGFHVHLLVDQEGEEATSIKTVAATLGGGKLGTDSAQVFMRYKEDANLISASRDIEPPSAPDEPNFTDQCIDLTTARCVDTSECVDLGIDLNDTPFLAFPDETNVFMPADFPESPTF